MFLLMVLSALLVGPVFAAGMIFPPPPAQCKKRKPFSIRNQFGQTSKSKDQRSTEGFDLKKKLFD